MPKITYNNIEFDSEEERLFYLYIEELKDTGYVKDYTFHTESFNLSDVIKYDWKKKLKTKVKEMQSTLLREHVYTPDYCIHWEDKAHGVFFYDIYDGVNKLDLLPFINNIYSNGKSAGTFIEIKPAFDMQNMQRLFTINQKWLYQKEHIYVQKIIPVSKKKTCLFAKTFVPQEAMLTAKTKKPKKYHFEVKSLKEFLNEK
jgi:hypothetical protein